VEASRVGEASGERAPSAASWSDALGEIGAVIGTHTHVATANERVLPGGTAHITDVGMTGPHDSVIGMEKSTVIKRFLDGLPARFEVAGGNVQMNAVLIEADPATGRALAIERRRYRIDE
jgi:2',3'-cyclic-nucleotide 2'-phosphodiesterase